MGKNEIRVVVLALMLVGCSASQHEEGQTQYAQKARIDSARSVTMEQQCRDKAAHQYNTQPARIHLEGVDAFQGSYELRGATGSQEQFTCTFETDGQFLHLSMR
jgi:outer membrane PBP1 activator LpoA protein